MKFWKQLPMACAFVTASAAFLPQAGAAQDANLAQQLANPIAAIISVPFQLNYDNNMGAAGTGNRTTLNLQPVIPFSLDNGANIVTRTIIPFIWQDDVVPGTSQSGVGDILFNAWYSKTTESNLTWGIGPIVRIPTGSDVSTETWAAGITGIALKVSGPWTFGALGNHLWDLESNPTTPTSSTFFQPFAAYTTDSSWTFTLASESTYDRISKQWSIPVNLSVSKLAPIGNTLINWQGGIGYWVTSPANGPEGWRVRLQAQIVIPKT
jgi:hypothetical protein